jgi:hypothetical protein
MHHRQAGPGLHLHGIAAGRDGIDQGAHVVVVVVRHGQHDGQGRVGHDGARQCIVVRMNRTGLLQAINDPFGKVGRRKARDLFDALVDGFGEGTTRPGVVDAALHVFVGRGVGEILYGIRVRGMDGQVRRVRTAHQHGTLGGGEEIVN